MERDRLPFTGARFFKVVSIILASVARIRPPPCLPSIRSIRCRPERVAPSRARPCFRPAPLLRQPRAADGARRSGRLPGDGRGATVRCGPTPASRFLPPYARVLPCALCGAEGVFFPVGA